MEFFFTWESNLRLPESGKQSFREAIQRRSNLLTSDKGIHAWNYREECRVEIGQGNARFEWKPWKPRKTAFPRQILPFPFPAISEVTNETLRHMGTSNGHQPARADVDDEKLAAAIRFERYDRRETRKKTDLTGGSGRRKSIILGRSTGKILCLRRLILRCAGNLLHAGECRIHFPPFKRCLRPAVYLGWYTSTAFNGWIDLLQFTSTKCPRLIWKITTFDI